MIIENTRFGAIEIKDEKIITMKRDMPGFPGRNRFVMLNRKESHPFLWYQSVDDPQIAFVLINPYLVEPDYSVNLKGAASEMSWDPEEEKNLAVFVIVNVPPGAPDKMTANLMAPIIINTERLEAVQMIYQDRPYSHQYPIYKNGKNDTRSQLAANG